MDDLTCRQDETLQAIANIWRSGHAPTTGELLAVLRLKTESGLTDLLKYLGAKGYIIVTGGVRGRQRLIELTSKGRVRTKFGIPVLGEVPAGSVAEAIQECSEWLDGAQFLLKARPDDFALKVKGDSMIGDGILSKDRILLRPNIEWRPGEVVAAQIRDESRGIFYGTLKHLDVLDDGQTVRLRASNPSYDDMFFDARMVSVAGVYRGLARIVE